MYTYIQVIILVALLLATTLKTTLATGRGGSTRCVSEQY